ncbi:MAG TPA: lysophospholipid acyltransferase family protein, partial [Candidatus Omnitrophota bacterium]|nr:lysophospholipid acyltransferase family protein [Candidatus Omnitrophota bacterium]
AKYILYKIGLFLLRHLPPKLSYKLATFVSDLQYFFSFRDRRAVSNNLRNILPASDKISFLTKDVFRNFGRYLCEFFQMREMVDGKFIKNNVRIEGIDRLDRILKEGKGGIIVTGHIGNWELGGVLLSVLGYPLMAIALPHKERPVNDLFNSQRESKGVTVVPPTGALRRCIEQLRANKLVALVADRDFSHAGVAVDFLGKKMIVPKGPAMFSLKTGAPIVPMFLIRNTDKTFTMFCCEPIYPPQENKDQDEPGVILGLMRRYLSVMEEKIRQYPSQWLLFREFSLQ